MITEKIESTEQLTTEQLTEEQLTEEDLTKLREFSIKTDPLTAFSIELLYTDLINVIEENEPKLVGHYSLFGVAESLTRAAKLLLKAAPSNPELAHSLVNIANTVSYVGEKLTKEFDDSRQDVKRENTLLNSDEIDLLMKAISGINVDLPEELK